MSSSLTFSCHFKITLLKSFQFSWKLWWTFLIWLYSSVKHLLKSMQLLPQRAAVTANAVARCTTCLLWWSKRWLLLLTNCLMLTLSRLSCTSLNTVATIWLTWWPKMCLNLTIWPFCFTASFRIPTILTIVFSLRFLSICRVRDVISFQLFLRAFSCLKATRFHLRFTLSTTNMLLVACTTAVLPHALNLSQFCHILFVSGWSRFFLSCQSWRSKLTKSLGSWRASC